MLIEPEGTARLHSAVALGGHLAALGASDPTGRAVRANTRDRAPQAERSAISGICEQCREPFRGRQDKCFRRDPGRKRRT